MTGSDSRVIIKIFGEQYFLTNVLLTIGHHVDQSAKFLPNLLEPFLIHVHIALHDIRIPAVAADMNFIQCVQVVTGCSI